MKKLKNKKKEQSKLRPCALVRADAVSPSSMVYCGEEQQGMVRRQGTYSANSSVHYGHDSETH